MLRSPQLVEVQIAAEAFERMKNLKFLIIENVHICEALKNLPNSLILFKWPRYRFSLPSNFFPHQLVALEMPRSCVELSKLFYQV